VSIGAGEGNLDAMALSKPQKIVGAIREAVEIVMGAGRGRLKKDGYKGEHFQVTYPCAYEWLKAPPPLIYLGAYRHQMMRAGGRVADGVYIGCTPVEILSPAIAAIREGIARRESPGDRIKINSFWAWHLKRDRAEGYRESRRELAWRARKLDPELINLFLSPEDVKVVRDHWNDFVAAWFDRSGKVKGVPDRITNALCEGFTSTGGLEDLDREIERFKKFGKAGQTTISLRLHDNPMEALEIIGKHVVPALR
jgi:alkanesulfonate monooxygenase SsuD/methylene tetrahydromethanopterin reductase-like flavin-dependent oxidoreductase (luciferase family)